MVPYIDNFVGIFMHSQEIWLPLTCQGQDIMAPRGETFLKEK